MKCERCKFSKDFDVGSCGLGGRVGYCVLCGVDVRCDGRMEDRCCCPFWLFGGV